MIGPCPSPCWRWACWRRWRVPGIGRFCRPCTCRLPARAGAPRLGLRPSRFPKFASPTWRRLAPRRPLPSAARNPFQDAHRTRPPRLWRPRRRARSSRPPLVARRRSAVPRRLRGRGSTLIGLAEATAGWRPRANGDRVRTARRDARAPGRRARARLSPGTHRRRRRRRAARARRPGDPPRASSLSACPPQRVRGGGYNRPVRARRRERRTNLVQDARSVGVAAGYTLSSMAFEQGFPQLL